MANHIRSLRRLFSPRREERKTAREWEIEYDVYVLDVEEDLGDANRLLKRTEFEHLLATHQVLRRPRMPRRGTDLGSLDTRPTEVTRIWRREPGQQAQQVPPQAAATAETRTDWPSSEAAVSPEPMTLVPPSRRRRRWLWALLLATVPTLATWLLARLHRWLASRLRIAWYWLAGVLVMDAMIVWLSPVAALVSGPGYLWYLVADAVGRVVNQLALTVLHGVLPLLHKQNVTPTLPKSFVETIVLAGNPLPVYFSIGQCVTSSLVIASALVAGGELWQRVRRGQRPLRQATDTPDEPGQTG
jgi:hypothetical protein